jgi:quercetin dioxygenase-like cupin family protein
MTNQNESNQNGLSQNQVKHVPAGTGPAYCGPGDRMTFLITGAETSGAFFMAEVSVAPGGGPPPHVHSREDESFYLQQGTLAVQVGDKSLNVVAGDFVHMPRGTAHSSKNLGNETAKLLMVATPAVSLR